MKKDDGYDPAFAKLLTDLFQKEDANEADQACYRVMNDFMNGNIPERWAGFFNPPPGPIEIGYSDGTKEIINVPKRKPKK